MALVADETESSDGSDYNPMDLTFKNHDEIEEEGDSSMAKFKSISDRFASKSEPREEGSIYHIESVSSMSALISKRYN